MKQSCVPFSELEDPDRHLQALIEFLYESWINSDINCIKLPGPLYLKMKKVEPSMYGWYEISLSGPAIGLIP